MVEGKTGEGEAVPSQCKTKMIAEHEDRGESLDVCV